MVIRRSLSPSSSGGPRHPQHAISDVDRFPPLPRYADERNINPAAIVPFCVLLPAVLHFSVPTDGFTHTHSGCVRFAPIIIFLLSCLLYHSFMFSGVDCSWRSIKVFAILVRAIKRITIQKHNSEHRSNSINQSTLTEPGGEKVK